MNQTSSQMARLQQKIMENFAFQPAQEVFSAEQTNKTLGSHRPEANLADKMARLMTILLQALGLCREDLINQQRPEFWSNSLQIVVIIKKHWTALYMDWISSSGLKTFPEFCYQLFVRG